MTELAGVAALATVFVVGARRAHDPEPHNIPFVALGTALLWFGWFGFNAGSALAVSGVTGLAFLNTQICAAFAAVTWMAIDWVTKGKPSMVGFCVGAVAGLATVTPAAGYITPQNAMLFGILAGSVCYAAVIFRKKMDWDDALDVWGVHGVRGVLGILLLGLVATIDMNAAGADGFFFGGPEFFVKELVAVLFAAAWAFGFTFGMLKLINVITPVRVSESIEQTGLDGALHGELAYIEAGSAKTEGE